MKSFKVYFLTPLLNPLFPVKSGLLSIALNWEGTQVLVVKLSRDIHAIVGCKDEAFLPEKYFCINKYLYHTFDKIL
jgi:hypothetical protein